MAAEVDTITGSACEAVELGQVVPRPPSLKLCKIPPCQTFVPLGSLLSRRRRESLASGGSDDAPTSGPMPSASQYEMAARTLSSVRCIREFSLFSSAILAACAQSALPGSTPWTTTAQAHNIAASHVAVRVGATMASTPTLDRRCFPSVCATQLLVDSYGINCKFAVHMPRHVHHLTLQPLKMQKP